MATRGIFCPRPTVGVGSCRRGEAPVGEGIKVGEAMVGEGKSVLFCPRPAAEVGSCRRGDAPVGEVIEVGEAMVSEGRIGWSPAGVDLQEVRPMVEASSKVIEGIPIPRLILALGFLRKYIRIKLSNA